MSLDHRHLARRASTILGSYGLSCTLLLFLLLLTFLGTLEQADHSLYDVQRKYFESLIVVGDVLPVPLPGAYLLLSVLFVNLVVGGMLRLRKSWSRAGIFTVHVGIAVMLLAGLVEYKTSNKGHLTLFEGESGQEFRSYFEWEIAVEEELAHGARQEHVVPNGRFAELGRGESVRLVSDQLPFDLVLSGFLRNCRPRQAAGGDTVLGVEGVVLEELPVDSTAEANVAGLTAAVEEHGGARQEGLLWGFQRGPWSVTVGGRRWHVHLRKRSFELPFRVLLRDFTRELHPGTGMASKFYSDVAVIEGNVSQDLRISMNEPLRRHGFTLYQASWGPGNARPGDRLFSTFAVVQNPADRAPLWACVIIALGLLLHFVPKLARHVKTQPGGRTA